MGPELWSKSGPSSGLPRPPERPRPALTSQGLRRTEQGAPAQRQGRGVVKHARGRGAGDHGRGPPPRIAGRERENFSSAETVRQRNGDGGALTWAEHARRIRAQENAETGGWTRSPRRLWVRRLRFPGNCGRGCLLTNWDYNSRRPSRQCLTSYPLPLECAAHVRPRFRSACAR